MKIFNKLKNFDVSDSESVKNKSRKIHSGLPPSETQIRGESLIIGGNGKVFLKELADSQDAPLRGSSGGYELFKPTSVLSEKKKITIVVMRIALIAMVGLFGISLTLTSEANIFRDLVAETGVILFGSALIFLRALWVEKDRWAWASMGVALTVWAVGDLLYYFQYGLSGASPTSEAFENNWLSAVSYIFMYISVIALIKNRLDSKSRNSSEVALNSLMAVLISVAYLSLFFDFSAGGDLTSLTFIGSVANLILSMTLVALLFAVLDVNHFLTDRMWWVLIFGGVFLWYADMNYYISESYRYGTMLDLFWIAGLSFLALASWEAGRGKFKIYNNLHSLISPIVVLALAVLLLVYGNLEEIPSFSAIIMGAALSVSIVRIYQIMSGLFEAEKLYNMAFQDNVTPAWNAFYLTSILTRLDKSKPRNYEYVLLVVDLLNLREINETFGSEIGDELIFRTFEGLNDVFPKVDTVSRLHSGKFGVLFESQYPRDESFQKFKELKIHLAHKNFMYKNVSLTPKINGGAACWPGGVSHAKDLLHKADIAVNEVSKSEDNESFMFYDKEVERRKVGKFLVEKLFQDAIKGDELSCHYQPKLDLATGLVNEVEALVRWKHSGNIAAPPNLFMPAIKDAGMSFDLFEKVLNIVTKQAVQWRKDGIPIRPSVNVSLTDFKRKDFIETVKKACDDNGLPYNGLMLEILEDDDEDFVTGRVKDNFKELTEDGFSIALDDFGAGKSDFSRLASLNFREVKIDKSLISGIDRDIAKFQKLKYLVDELHNQGLLVVAEGVENAQEFDRTAEAGCDYVQGYYVGTPMNAKQVEKFLEKFNPQTITVKHENLFR